MSWIKNKCRLYCINVFIIGDWKYLLIFFVLIVECLVLDFMIFELWFLNKVKYNFFYD